MIRYKITDENMKTYNDTQWGIGKEKTVSGTGELCSPGWLHVYTSPLLAVLLNPIHANFKPFRLFECECMGKNKSDNNLKEGWEKIILKKEIEIPKITVEQKIKFAILCAKKVCKNKKWVLWANNWLNGKNRNKKAAAAGSKTINFDLIKIAKEACK